jgi:hypothetical protein
MAYPVLAHIKNQQAQLCVLAFYLCRRDAARENARVHSCANNNKTGMEFMSRPPAIAPCIALISYIRVAMPPHKKAVTPIHITYSSEPYYKGDFLCIQVRLY